jgi:hypothetical protein
MKQKVLRGRKQKRLREIWEDMKSGDYVPKKLQRFEGRSKMNLRDSIEGKVSMSI